MIPLFTEVGLADVPHLVPMKEISHVAYARVAEL
jgi:hypothetical protein